MFFFHLILWNLFRNEVIIHKNKLYEYKTVESPAPVKWSFDLDTIFERLNLYLIRLHDVHDIIDAANDFFKLEKIEMGNTRGRYLGERITSVLNEFQTIYNTCIASNLNLLEPSNVKFKRLKFFFRKQITILERKLSQIFTEAFENSNSTESNLKLVEMIGGLLHRPIIKKQLTHQIESILENVQWEINTVDNLLDSDWNSAQIMVKCLFCFVFVVLTREKKNLFYGLSTEIIICTALYIANG